MTFIKIALIIILTTLFQFSNAQFTISLNEFDKGEYLAVKDNYSILRVSPDISSAIFDTIFDNYHGLSFIVLEENTTNNFVHVKVITSNWSNGMPDPETGMIVLPSIIENGKKGWILKEELMKHPVPNGFLMDVYKDDEEMLFAIIENAEWHSFNNKKDYPMYKSEQAESYLTLGKQYYEKDSTKKAIFYLTKSLQIISKGTPYIIRALAKIKLQDYQGAINDCDKGILLENNPSKPNVFDNSYVTLFDFKYDIIDFVGVRGFCYLQMKKYSSAITDFNNAIKNDDTNGQLYYYRGIAKYNSGQKASGCQDFSKAGELGFETAYEVIQSMCN